MDTSQRKLSKALLVMTRRPTDQAEREGTGTFSEFPVYSDDALQGYTCFENELFLGSGEHRRQVADEIHAHVVENLSPDAEIYVLFHALPKKNDMTFIHAQLGLMDFLLAHYPERVHPTLVGIEGDDELVSNMRASLADKRLELSSRLTTHPLLTVTLDGLGWSKLELLKQLSMGVPLEDCLIHGDPTQ